MAAKPVKAPVTSATKSASFRRVNKRISSAFTPARSNAFRLRATAAVVRKHYATQPLRPVNPKANHSPYFGTYAALRRMQSRYLISRMGAVAKQQSSHQSLQLAAGNWARVQAAQRSSRAQFRSLAKYGLQRRFQQQVTRSANAAPLSENIAHVTARSRNTSAAARVQQSIRAQKGNQLRKGRTYKKGGGSSGSAFASSPKVSTSRRRTGLAPARALQTPKAARSVPRKFEGEMLNPWVVAGNTSGTENCAAVAVANHLWYHKSCRMTDEQVNVLSSLGQTIPELLKALADEEIFDNAWPEFWCSKLIAGPGDLIVFDTAAGMHAGLLLPDRMVVSWGEEVPFRGQFLEGWHIRWQAHLPRA